jgi:hypothetical protein
MQSSSGLETTFYFSLAKTIICLSYLLRFYHTNPNPINETLSEHYAHDEVIFRSLSGVTATSEI